MPQRWTRLAPGMRVEWQQCMDEGKMVEAFLHQCEALAQADGDHEQEAEALLHRMQSAPIQKRYEFEEPSDYAAIVHALPSSSPLPDPDPARAPDKLLGAYNGRVAGCLLGKPVEGWRLDRLIPLLKATGNDPLNRYLCLADIPEDALKALYVKEGACWADTTGGIAPVDDDTNYTVLALKLVEHYGVDFTPDDVLAGWMRWLPYMATCTAERVAYRNAAVGLDAPLTATHKNPYREWIGAQIRADFYGYLCPGDPRRAAFLAWKDASCSHVKNGIYGAMMVAAMTAAAASTSDVHRVVEEGLCWIPQKSRLRQALDQVFLWYMQDLSAAEALKRVHERYDEHDEHAWCHVIPNAMIVVLALLYSAGDPVRAMCLAVQAGFDTDCNGATAGSIAGMMRGASAFPIQWTEPFRDGLRTSVEGYSLVTAQQLATRTLELSRQYAGTYA